MGFTVPKNMANFSGNMHGGAYATLVDVATTLAIVKVDPLFRKHATIELTESCMYPAKVGDKLFIRAECLRLGSVIAFTECKIVLEKNLKMIVSGRQIKAMHKDNEAWDPYLFELS